MSAATLFKFNKDYDDFEQVRPYFADYMRRCDALADAGKYPYNDEFIGQIPGLIDSPDENRGIYMLQVLRNLDEVSQHVEAFKADGGREVTPRAWATGVERRGTLARYGWYMNGEGWEVLEDVRVTLIGGEVHYKQPRQRQWRRRFGGNYLFKEGDK